MDASSTQPSSEPSAITEPSKQGSAASPPGYRSQKSKKRFIIIVGLLAVLFYGAQEIVPRYFNSSEPFLAVEEIEFKDHEISHSATRPSVCIQTLVLMLVSIATYWGSNWVARRPIRLSRRSDPSPGDAHPERHQYNVFRPQKQRTIRQGPSRYICQHPLAGQGC